MFHLILNGHYVQVFYFQYEYFLVEAKIFQNILFLFFFLFEILIFRERDINLHAKNTNVKCKNLLEL